MLLTAPESVINAVPDDQPDVEGVFFAEATQQDFKDMQDEDSGMKGWLDRLKRP